MVATLSHFLKVGRSLGRMITIRDGNNTHQQDLEPPSMVLLYLWDQGPTTLYM